MGWWYFDDGKVYSYINSALAENSNYQPIDNQLEMAWSSLFMQRENEDPEGDNRELAAAEHYMYARWQVCTGKTWADVMRARAIGYDMAKLLGYIPLVFAIRKLAGHSWSRPSTDSIRWGLRGCNQGVQDSRAISPDQY